MCGNFFPRVQVPQNGIKEGKACVVGMEGNEVFYNPVQVRSCVYQDAERHTNQSAQVLNRDLSVIAIQEFQKLFEKERNDKSAAILALTCLSCAFLS